MDAAEKEKGGFLLVGPRKREPKTILMMHNKSSYIVLEEKTGSSNFRFL